MKKFFSFCLVIAAVLLTLSPQIARAQAGEYFNITIPAYSSGSFYIGALVKGNPGIDLSYSYDKITWTPVTTVSATESVVLKLYNQSVGTSYAALTVYFKGNNTTPFHKDDNNFVHIIAYGSATYPVRQFAGNIMSLVYGDDFQTQGDVIPCDYCFKYLFSGTGTGDKVGSSYRCDASNLCLPATELTEGCYYGMFEPNINYSGNYFMLTGYPQLPAQNLKPYCYARMFAKVHPSAAGNTSILLPAEELADHCYDEMFHISQYATTTYTRSVEIMATSLRDMEGDLYENPLRQMFYYSGSDKFAATYHWGNKTTIYFDEWGQTVANTTTTADVNNPTYNWWGGYYDNGPTYLNFYYDKNLPNWNTTTGSSTSKKASFFPQYSTCTAGKNAYGNDIEYVTFNCASNGGYWNESYTYNTNLRRVVRSTPEHKMQTFPSDPQRIGSTFLGWYTAPTGGTKVEKSTILNQTTAQTYYAQFDVNDIDYTLTISNGAHGHVVVTKNNAPTANYTTTSSVHNLSELTITAVPDAGYRFKAWTGEAATIKAAEDAGNTYYLVDDITVGATFEADECTVTIQTPAEYGSLAASDGTNNYVSGTTYTFNRQLDLNKTLTFTATPAIHRLFTGFIGTELSNVTAAPYVYDQVVTGTYTITAATPDEVTVGATFVKPTFTVTTSITGKNGGYVTLTADGYPDRTGSGTYDIDTRVTLTATPSNEMFKFVRWTDNDSDNPVRIIDLTADVALEAEFDLDGDLWSAPATVDVYANGYTLKGGTNVMPTSATSTNFRILYNLDPVVGNDGITYTPVDMGAGVAWADRNVGAADPTKAGSYFYWGGVEPVTSVSNTIYNTNVANEATLPLEKDAARQIMGENWRMPTGTEMSNFCSTTYVNKATVGSYNYQHTNKYYPDDKIFIPASGRYQTTGSSAITNQKTTSYLYSSTRASSSAASSKIGHFYADAYQTTSSTAANYALCWYAEPVRAVYEPPFETCTLTVIVYWASTPKYYYKYICEVGQTVTIKQHPNYTKYVFSAWRENTYNGTSLSTDNSYSVTLTGDQTIAAHYVSNNSATVLLTVNPLPAKGGTADGGGYYANGTNVTLTATPNENYRFVRWLDGNTSNPRAYKTTASAVTLTAEFEYTGTATSADANEEVFAYMPQTNCFKVLYDYPASLTGDDGITYRLVDMGNGVLWANKNVGAADSTKAGSYFYWGGTTPVTTVGTATTWAGAQDMLLTTSYTTYSTLSPKVAQYALPADNDAATVKMGERWRMPTYEEIYYLANPTGAAETGAAASGYTYTNTLSGEKLFIPNSGYYNKNNSTTITKDHSLFWASTMGKYDATNSSCVAGYYYDGSATANSSTYGYIWYAMPVRGVYVPPFETCTIKVQVAGGSNQLGNSTTTYYRYYVCEKGQKLRLTAHPHSVGATTWTYAFTGWTDVTNCNATLSDDPTYEFIVSEDKEIMATFAATTTNISTIQALPLPRSGGYVYGVGRYKNGVTTQLHAVPEEGYTFVRWEDNNSTNPYREITVNGDASYNAVFTSAVPAAASAHKYVNVWHEATTTTTETLYDGSPLETCTLTVKTYQSNSGKATYNFVCEKGQTVTVSAFTNTANYSLLHWTNLEYDIMSYDPTVELVVTEDITYIATFYTTRATTRTLTLDCTPREGAIFDGAIKGNTNHIGVYEDGQVTKIVCHPNPHYRFLYWDDDHNLNDTARIVTVTEDRTYTAVLEMDYDLSTVTSPDAFASVYGSGTNIGTYIRYLLPGYDANGYRPVDVGVGVAWANKNIGAADSTKAGDYFVWGLTTPATTVSSSGTNYWTGVTSMSSTLTSSNTAVQYPLPAANDAATQIMGERWRMATYQEIYNLANVTGSGSTEEGQASAGFRYTNKEDNSQFIFIPAAGCKKTSGAETVTTGTTHFWGSTVKSVSAASSQPTYYLSGGCSAGSTTYYAWNAMPIRAVYVPPFQTCSVKVLTPSNQYMYICEVGQRITITAFYGAATATNQNSRVRDWIDQNNVIVSTDQTYSFIALSNVTLTVNFVAPTTKRTLTFNVSPAGTGTVNNLATFVGNYEDGQHVRIPVKAAENYRFSHWSDDENNTDPNRIFTATANATYTAVFEPDEAQAADAHIAQAATRDTTKILYPLPVLYKNSMFYTPVDMGTGTAWCDYNVGVTNPTSPNGYYFLWGGNANKTSTYKTTTYTSGAVTNTTEGGDLPYNNTYDAALNQMGTGWRVPSKEQWDALVDKCSTETENTFVNPTDNSKSISLPKAGSYAPNSTTSYSTLSSGMAAYWSSTLAVKNGQSSQPYVYFNGSVTYGADIPISGRQGYVSYGMPVRAVYQPTFTPCTLTVRYTNDEDVTRTNTYLCQPGQPVRITAIPSEGYVFKKWNDNDTHAERTIFISEDMTLTAEFEEANAGSALIITQVNNGEWGSVTGGGEYDKGAAVTLTAQPEEHYHFVKWQLNDADIEGGATLNFTATAIATYKAFFAIDEHTLTTTATNGTVTGGGTYDYGTTDVTLTATADDHYHFVKWQLNGEDIPGEASLTVDVTADATYNAVFAIDRHTLSVTATHGTATGSGEYDYGTVVTLGVTPDEHYHFVSWSDDGAQSHSVTVTADAEYTATCSIDRFTLTVNGSNATVTGAGEYDYNTQVTVTVSPDMGYNFVRWTDGETNPSRIVTMTEDKTLAYETVYVPSYAITTVANGGVIYQTADRYEQQNGPTTYSYMNGTVLTLEVAASFGYAFTGWSDGNSDNPRVVTVTEAKTYTAQFSEQTNIVFHQTTGVLDFPTYAKNTFAIIGETDDVTFRLYFNTAISTNKTDYLSNLSLDASQSYIQPTVGAKRTIASATVANVEYFGNQIRAAHLTAMLTDTEGRTYDVDIYTNEMINYATYQEDYTYKYYSSYLSTESSWVNGRTLFKTGEENNFPLNIVNSNYHTLGYWYSIAGSSAYDIINIKLQFITDESKPGVVPTGVYPINSTQQPGTAFIGVIPSNYIERQTNNNALNYGCVVFRDYQDQSTYVRTTDNWTLRGGYIEVVNVDEQYYVHVHATADAYRTNGEAANTLLDFTLGGSGNNDVPQPVAITLSAQTAGGEALTDAVTATLAGASNWTDVEIGQGSHTFFSGNTLNLTAAKPGYVFSHWTVNGITVAGEDYTYAYTVGTADAAIVAVFELDTRPFFTIAAETSGRGTATLTADGYKPQTGSGYYAENTNVTITVAAGTGATFLGWDDNNDGTVDNTQNPRTVTATADKTYTAVFGLESADQAVNVYQAAAADTMKILYNLDAKTGLDGKTYIPVDLGYGVAWADRNVGATGTNVIGSYFRWGDPVASNTFNSSTHIDASGFSTGDKLSNEQDAAYVNMGTCWHMPDKNELLALKANTDLSNNNTFTNRTDNTKSIVFLAGGYKGNSHYDPDYQYYWSREYAMYGYNSKTNSNERTCFAFVRCTDNVYYASNYDKDDHYGNEYYLGMPVRAIYEPEYPTYKLTINVGTKQYKYICQAGQNITVTANATVAGQVFDKWTEDNNTNATRTFTMTGNITRTATFKEAPAIPTYDITWKSEDGTSTLETDNAQAYGTPTAYNGATTPTKTVTGYTYTFDGWTTKPNGAGTFYANGATPAVSGAATYYAHFTGTVNTHTLAWVANGGTLTGGTTAGTTAYGTTLDAPTATREGYTFTGWSPSVPATMPDDDATFTAQWNIVNYTITYKGLEDETNSNPTSYNIESETITLVAPGERSGYVFTGWTLGGSPITEIVSGSTGDKTLTATWEEMPSEIVLEDNRENSFYDTFKAKYDGAEDVTVVYNRQFPKSKWATLCLPFDVNSALLNSVDMGGRVYEFKKAEGNAETGINLYFATAATIKAGKGYIVNANAKLASKSSFRFPDVKINLESDKGDELNSQASYDALEGTSTDGNIELVGTLRKGRLRGVDGKNRYMGLKDNKIYYPNISTAEGSLILAYRGIFRSIEGTLNAERIRIVVDGEDMGELLIENGRMTIDNDATRKFVKDGVLYIEREGVIYDAQGKRVEN